ncbi:MAG: acetyl-CoA carboxylase biotin carboxylase subunit, partial [Gammaproteobacteria bacterium]|nr:acetyl-CoA carboxylase biotin carboxylase subunit [Gammaproteobacteria bacterium]
QPSPGTVSAAQFPAGPGIRIDSHIETGSVVPPYYDSLLGKLIVWGEDRATAMSLLKKALEHCQIDGIENNIILHRAIMASEEFTQGAVDSLFLNKLLETVSLEKTTNG